MPLCFQQKQAHHSKVVTDLKQNCLFEYILKFFYSNKISGHSYAKLTHRLGMQKMITKRCTNLFKVSYPSERSEFRCIFSSQPNVSHLLVVNRRHFISISPTITDMNLLISIVSKKELVLKTLLISQSASRSLPGPSCH